MRTTLDIDEDVLAAARALARLHARSLGSVVSELARKGLAPSPVRQNREALPVFDVPEGAPTFGPEEVARALEER